MVRSRQLSRIGAISLGAIAIGMPGTGSDHAARCNDRGDWVTATTARVCHVASTAASVARIDVVVRDVAGLAGSAGTDVSQVIGARKAAGGGAGGNRSATPAPAQPRHPASVPGQGTHPRKSVDRELPPSLPASPTGVLPWGHLTLSAPAAVQLPSITPPPMTANPARGRAHNAAAWRWIVAIVAGAGVAALAAVKPLRRLTRQLGVRRAARTTGNP